jgi:uncharacterized protein YoxC
MSTIAICILSIIFLVIWINLIRLWQSDEFTRNSLDSILDILEKIEGGKNDHTN